MERCNSLFYKVYRQLARCSARGLWIGDVPITYHRARGGAQEDMDTLTGGSIEGCTWPEWCTGSNVTGPESE